MKKTLIFLFLILFNIGVCYGFDITDKVYSLTINDIVYSISFEEVPFSGGSGCSFGDMILEDSDGNIFKMRYEYFCDCKMGYLNDSLLFNIRDNKLKIYNLIVEFDEVKD